ncbi:MAG: protein kinase domain-containing protein [Gemmataceae bacterium]
MPAPATIGEFLDLVRKSGVLEDKRLDAYIEKATAAGLVPEEPSKLAGLLVRDGILTHFQAEQFLQGKWRRFTIGKYKVLERIGSGGMGSVYLCEHKLMRRRVAVKVLPTAKADDTSSLERFHREARVVAALDHINIVRAYDVDQDNNLHFLVMEYVDGASLQEMIKRGGVMDVTRAAHYMRQSAMGLQHAHETAGIVHRDIKPGNILVDRYGIVKILDMGLARFFHDDEDVLTKKYDENVLGTADYLAPEQALDSHSVDIRADIYSLGATFYYCLTGRSPFNEGTVAQKLIWHQTRQPKAIRTIRPDVPQGIEALVEKMMAKDRNQRFQMPSEIAEALAPYTKDPIGPPPEIEMPQLCPAAKGATVPDGGPATPAPVSPAPISASSRKSWQISGGPDSKAKGPPTPSTGNGNDQIRNDQKPSANQPVPARPKVISPAAQVSPRATAMPELSVRPQPAKTSRTPAAAAVASRPSANGQHPVTATATASSPSPDTATDDDSIPWEQIAAQTEVASKAATPRDLKAGPSSKRVAPEPTQAEIQRKQTIRLVSVIAGAVAAGIGIAVLAAIVFRSPKPDSKTSDNPGEHIVTVGGTGSQYQTLKAALQNAKPGDRIMVSGTIEETGIKMDFAKSSLKNVSIEGSRGPVTWRLPPADTQTKHLLYLENAEGLTIKGLTFDGGNRAEDIIVLTGRCAGLTLKDVTLQGFKEYACSIVNCAGEADKPVSLIDLTLLSSLPQKAKAPIHFTIQPQITNPKKNEHIKIQNCHIRGGYVDSASPKTDGVEVVNWHVTP